MEYARERREVVDGDGNIMARSALRHAVMGE